jgi:hypothetical protein
MNIAPRAQSVRTVECDGVVVLVFPLGLRLVLLPDRIVWTLGRHFIRDAVVGIA